MPNQSALSRILQPLIRTLGQGTISPAPVRAVYVTTGVGAALGIAAGLIPKKSSTLRHLALGGSVAALGLTALLFALGD
jgi:hypothetical protein